MSETTKERPILFSGEMVRAILDGRKCQTRRVIKPPLARPLIGYLGYIPERLTHWFKSEPSSLELKANRQSVLNQGEWK